ncbi:MAG: exodeoxyribonuclease VII large subunit, partial [Planctomycetota bacterium]|nr:exodeoxyribonuclease VII large subunit [Planctomycetota bacterium]
MRRRNVGSLELKVGGTRFQQTHCSSDVVVKDQSMGYGDPNAPLSVSELTQHIQQQLNQQFQSVWVSGEISNLAKPRSGHLYMALKDEGAVLQAAIWRSVASRLQFDLEDGLEVICRGDIDVYPPRGSYQLIVRDVVPKGLGSLQLAFKQLFERLQREGLFDEQHKQTLPRIPRKIAFVTSPTGAAVRDFLEVLRRRWRDIHVLVVPAKVQGRGAAEEIAAGIRKVNALRE